MIYFDNSATTELSPSAKESMKNAMEVYGNPSSLHKAGLEAEKLLRTARADVLRAMGAKNGELVFTSCGSEANNLALFGSAWAKQRRTATKILLTDSEHPAVENPVKRLEEQGFRAVRIPTKGGVLDLDAVEREAEGVFLASFMMVNNETGARYDVEKAFSIIRAKSPDAVLHCDAVQGFLKVPFKAADTGADLITVSAHKIHGPKGVGALWIAPDMIKKKKIVPFLLGGGQENGMRSGTENTVGICGFAAAAKDGYDIFARDTAKMKEIREYIISHMPADIRVNMPIGEAAPHIVNITLPKIKSETMLHFLSAKDIFVSSGSACSSHSRSVSRALTAFGLDAREADMSLRISISAYNTEEEAEALISALKEGTEKLVKIR